MDDGIGVFVAIVLAVGLLLGFAVGHYATRDVYREAAIQRGYAIYCPTSGNFSWRNECGEM